LNGVYHFLQRVWGLQEKIAEGRPEFGMTNSDLQMMHATIKKVTEDIQNIKLNTPIAALMEWLNYLSKKEQVQKEEYQTLLILLAPFAPHITEEIWSNVILNSFQDPKKMPLTKDTSEQVRHDKLWSIHQQSWPVSDMKHLVKDEIEIALLVNGKLRNTMMISSDIINNEKDIEKMALADLRVQKFLDNKPVVKTIYIPGKIINFVV
jgi:leucyl-tRNA synthetase